MKPLNFVEFNSYVHWAGQILAEAQLQDIWTNDRYLVLEFYKYRSIWLVCDLQPQSAQIILMQSQRPAVTKKPKPLSLFLHSHAENMRVEFFKTRPEFGRVAVLSLIDSQRSCLIEMQL